MGDNKLNLVVQFTALDGLSGALKGMIGLGRSSNAEMKKLGKELGEVSRQVKSYDDKIRNTTGSVNHLWDAQKKLLQQEEQLKAKIEQRQRIMAIDGRTAKIQAQADRYKQEGQAGLMWGAALAYPAYEMAKSAGEFEALRNKLFMLGLNNKAVDSLTAYAKGMNIAGSSAKENLRYLLEAQGAFRESGAHSLDEQLSGARIMAPLMAKMAATLHATGKELGEEQERYFLRFIEQAGGMTDKKRAAALTDGLFRAIQSSGGTVDAAAYQGFLARAGTAGMKMSMRAMFADFEPLITELHDQAGVGLQTAYLRANGMVKNKAAMNEMVRLGLWNDKVIEKDALGGVKSFRGGENPLKADAAKMMATDPVEFYRKFVLPAYKAQGVKDVQRENVLLFGRTGGGLFNLIDKQMGTILHSRQAYARTQSLDRAYNQTKDGFFGEGGKLRAAWQDFTVAAGTKGGLLDSMTSGLRMATGALRALTSMANSHPTAFRWIATAVTALIGMKLATAAVKFAFGGLLGPVGRLWGLWSKYRELGSIAALFPRLARGFGIVRGAASLMGRAVGGGVLRLLPLMVRGFGMARTAVMFLGQGFLRAGLMMLANPMVLAITAVVVAIGLLGYLVYRNWGTIKAAFAQGWAWLVAKWQGLKGWFVGLAGQMGSIGSNIIQGLVHGITSAPGAVWNALKSVVMSGVNGIKALLGIKSPSRLFMAMGGHITEGLAIGVDRNAHGPVRAVTRMAAAVAGAGALSLTPPAAAHGRIAGAKSITLAPAAARAPRAAAAPAKIEIHIHQRPGEDADALTRRVMDAIKREQRSGRLSQHADDF